MRMSEKRRRSWKGSRRLEEKSRTERRREEGKQGERWGRRKRRR